MTITPPQPNQLFIIGITGSMGCGKSTVTQLFAQHGARVLDADQLAREAVEPGTIGWQQVVESFGGSVLQQPRGNQTTEQPPLDRKKLGAIVFSNPKKRQLLEAIIHPKVETLREQQLNRWQQALPHGGERVVVMEVPLLFETNTHLRCNLTLAVVCGAQQWQRLEERTGMSEETKQAAIDRQLSEAEKIAHAHLTIDNSGPPKETAAQVDRIWRELTTIT
jgi:dephospho-CoA kinase